MELEKGVQRWIVDISNWRPSPHHFNLAMSLLPRHQHSSITRLSVCSTPDVFSGQIVTMWVEESKRRSVFTGKLELVTFDCGLDCNLVLLEDRKRALVSRLLQFTLVNQVLGIPFDEIIIERTPEGKPFLVCDSVESGFPNFNFNVSHHGDYVAIASEPMCLVGLDIVSHFVPVNETTDKFIQSFLSYFSDLEWRNICNAGSSNEMLRVFYRYWCLKEAYVKAIGSGVGHKLDDVEFNHINWDNISVKIAGEELKDWKFWLLEIGENHSVSIARGHPRTAISTYAKTLKKVELNEEEHSTGLNLRNPSFTFLTIDELVQSWRDGLSSKLKVCDRAELEQSSSFPFNQESCIMK